MLDHGLAPRISYFFLEHLQTPSSSKLRRVFERCFKEYFSKNYLNISKENFGSGQQFYCKRAAAVDRNFIVNVQRKATTLLKLYSRTIFSWVIFGIFGKNCFTFRYLLPLPRRIWNPIENLWWNFLVKIVKPKRYLTWF